MSGKIFALFLVIATVALILVGTMWPNQSGSYVSDSNARLMGSVSSPQNAVNTLLQHLAEDFMRGRVMSIYATAFLGFAPIGSLIAGSLAGFENRGKIL